MSSSTPPPPPPCTSAASGDGLDEERQFHNCVHGLLFAAGRGDLHLLARMAVEVETVTRGKVGVGGVWSRGYAALHVAAANGQTDVCRFLLQDVGFPVDTLSTSEDETPLLLAAMYGHTTTAAYLLERGADPAKPDLDGETPLHWAAYNGDCELAKLLLSRGADVDVANPRATPLHVAAIMAHPAVVSILLDHRANPNRLANHFFTPLISSLLGQSLECMKLLIQAGASVNGSGFSGATPLILACSCPGLISFVKFLLEAGANPNICDELERLPIELAAIHADREAVELLFPLSDDMPNVLDWSVDGIIKHVNSAAYKEWESKAFPKRKDRLKLQGNWAFQKKDYDGATLLYSMAIKFDGTDSALYSNRSLCWLHLGFGDEALLDAQICCKMRPDWAKGYYRQGTAFRLLEDYASAFDAFLKASKLNPSNAAIVKALREVEQDMNRKHAHVEA